MKLSREDLKSISAGASAVEYGSLFSAIVAAIVGLINKIRSYFNQGSSGGGTTPPSGDGGATGNGDATENPVLDLLR